MDLFDNLDKYISVRQPALQLASPSLNLSIKSTSSNDSLTDSMLFPINSKNSKLKIKNSHSSQKGQKTAHQKLTSLKNRLIINGTKMNESETLINDNKNAKKQSPENAKKQSQKNAKTISKNQMNLTICSPKNLRNRLSLKRRTLPNRPHALCDEIDLVSSDDDKPTIVLDNLSPSKEPNSLLVDYESENYEMSIKVKWKSKMLSMKLRKYQKFGDLIDNLANKENVQRSLIALNLNEAIVNENDTPDSIGYTLGKFIIGTILSDNTALLKQKTATKTRTCRKTQTILVKIQSQMWKKPLELLIRKTDRMKVLIIKCAEELKCNPAKIKLEFDGELLNVQQTANDLELEGGEVFDMKMLK